MDLREAFEKEFRLQQIGTILWVVSLVLLYMKIIVPCYILVGGVLGIDLYLVSKKRKTITQWFRVLFPRKVDTIVTLVIVGLFMWQNLLFGLYFLQGSIHGHLNGDW